MSKDLTALFVVLMCAAMISSAAGATTGWIDFELKRGRIVFPVKIDGMDAEAMLDTGATGNMISAGFVERHGSRFSTSGKVRVSGVYGSRQVVRYGRIPLAMFGVEFKMSNVLAGNLGNVDMLIGLDFFDTFVVQLDYPRQRMRLIERSSIELKKSANVPLQHDRNSGLPSVEVTLNGELKTWLTFDTGNSGGLFLSRWVAQKQGWLEKYGVLNTRASGVNISGASNETFNLPNLKIGPFELENIIVSVPAQDQSTNIGPRNDRRLGARRGKNSVGLLGYDILKHFVVTIDFKKTSCTWACPNQKLNTKA